MTERMQNVDENYVSDRAIMSKKVTDMQNGRWIR
jgi:hypothetical protein